MARQTLTCQVGQHVWARESQRGKPPRNCPEHNDKATRLMKATIISVSTDNVSDTESAIGPDCNHKREVPMYGEDSYLDSTYDDQPTGGADFLPEDADSPEYAESCRDYVEPDDYQDYADEMADGFGNRHGWSDDEILQY